MKIAVSFENGKVFQHFGKTENFKVYEIEDGKIMKAEVIGTEGAGHEALADFLKEKGVDTVICGGMGNGALEALSAAGIDVAVGASGDADEAVEAFLAGNVYSQEANCHEHEEESSCGHNCGSCGGCHPQQILYEGKNAGKKVKVHYKGTLDDGTQFDSSYDRNEPLEFVCAVGMMIPGFDKAVVNMEVGEEVDIHLLPSEAYGEADPQAIFTVQLVQLPGAENLSVGQQVYLTGAMGQPFAATVVAKDDASITFDANHELAGKALNFHIQLVEVE